MCALVDTLFSASRIGLAARLLLAQDFRLCILEACDVDRAGPPKGRMRRLLKR